MSCKFAINKGSIFNKEMVMHFCASKKPLLKAGSHHQERLWINVIFSRYLENPGNSVLSMLL